MKALRLAQIALIAQGSMNSLNPVMRVRDQIAAGLADHGVQLSQNELEESIKNLLAQVGLPPQVANMFPHELSGGMKQRVVIAIAISLNPKVIIADEPTSALDVVVQRQVMETLKSIQTEIGASVILIGHDMGLMAQFVQRLGVIYAGRLMEVAPVRAIFRRPRHPYTQLLISSLPSTKEEFGISIIYITHDLTTAYQISDNIIVLYRGVVAEAGRVDLVVRQPNHPYTRLLVGSIPMPNPDHTWAAEAPAALPNQPRSAAACKFADRCPSAMTKCLQQAPPLYQSEPQRAAACFLYEGSPVLQAEKMDQVLQMHRATKA